MRRFFLAIPLVLCTGAGFSQKLGQVTFSGASNLSYFSVLTDQGVLIRISGEGQLLEWGTELLSYRADSYAPRLQPFQGRVDYYGPEADSAYQGKVKSIGTCAVTYYSHYEMNLKVGKLKSVGSLLLDYYDNYDNTARKGKLRFIGTLVLDYYPSIADETVRGKLKAIGNTPIEYYSSFEDKLIRGRIKSIGGVAYEWHTTYDSQLRGTLKSNLYRQNIGGIIYILR